MSKLSGIVFVLCAVMIISMVFVRACNSTVMVQDEEGNVCGCARAYGALEECATGTVYSETVTYKTCPELGVPANGIITLPGYAHAVVVCGEGTTINSGHEDDPEVAQLLALAEEMCPVE